MDDTLPSGNIHVRGLDAVGSVAATPPRLFEDLQTRAQDERLPGHAVADGCDHLVAADTVVRIEADLHAPVAEMETPRHGLGGPQGCRAARDAPAVRRLEREIGDDIASSGRIPCTALEDKHGGDGRPAPDGCRGGQPQGSFGHAPGFQEVRLVGGEDELGAEVFGAMRVAADCVNEMLAGDQRAVCEERKTCGQGRGAASHVCSP